jgi:LPXTG-motif cell wall-anchored protein
MRVTSRIPFLRGIKGSQKHYRTLFRLCIDGLFTIDVSVGITERHTVKEVNAEVRVRDLKNKAMKYHNDRLKGGILKMLAKKKISALLIMVLLVTQWAYGFGFGVNSQVYASGNGTVIGDNLITSVTLAVYTDDSYSNTVTESVYQLDSYSKLNYTWALPDNHGYKAGSTYTFDLPKQFELYNNLDDVLMFDDEPVGTYFVDKNTNKVVFTFNNYIETHDQVGGTFTVNSLLSSKKITGSTKQTLTFPIQGGTQTIELNFKPKVSSTIEKNGTPKPQHYNPTSIVWTVDANKVLDSVYNAVVTDKLPAGLSLNTVSIAVYELDVNVDGTVNTGNLVNSSKYDVSASSSGELNLKFTDSPITKAYRIAFSTDITGTGVDSTSFFNEAFLKGDKGISQKASTTVTVGRGKPLTKETTGYDEAKQIISWAVNFNYNEKTILAANAILKDSFNNSQDLISSSVKVYPVTIDGNGNGVKGKEIPSSEYTVTPTTGTGLNGFDLQFNNDVTSAYRIEYQTQANGRVYDDTDIKNKVIYNGETKDATRGIKQNILHKNNSNVDYAKKTIDWTITINDDSKTMENLVVTDTFGHAGLKLVPGTLKVKPTKGGTATVHSVVYTEHNPVAVNDGFVITFNGPISEPYTITYTTSFNYDWLASGETQFTNTAALKWKEIVKGVLTSKEKEVTSTFNPRDEVKNNGKKSGSYNAVTKEITWTIGANYNQKTLGKAQLVDTITAGQVVNKDSVKVSKLEYGKDGNPSEQASVNSADYDVLLVGNELKVTFNKTINYAFYVTFKTTFADQAIDSDKISNTAILYDDKKVESAKLQASVNIPKGGEYVNKGGEQDGNKIHWTININRNQSLVKEAVITDIPSDNQILLSNTFHVYTTTVASNGDITPTNQELTRDTDYKLEITTDIDGKESFKLSFLKDISEAYILKYDSLITANNGDKVTNKVSFTGKNIKIVLIPSNSEITVKLSSGSGTGSGVKGPLTITKVDFSNPTTLLSGATFDLYRVVDKDKIWIKEGTTGVNGVLEFTKLASGKYVLIEKTAPNGYVLDQTPHEVTIASTTGISLKVTNKVPTPTATPTPSPVATPTPSPVATPTPSPVATPTPSPVATPTPSPVVVTPTPTPVVVTPTPSPVVVIPTPTPTPENPTGPVSTPTPTPAVTPTTENPTGPVSTPIPGVIVTATPTPVVVATPTVTPTVVPTPTPIVVPSATPSQPVATNTPIVPQVTPPVQQQTTNEDIPIEGEIPLGGIPSVGDEPGHGKVTITKDGKWIYTPNPGFIGKDKFTIIVTDENGNEEEILIEIDVEEVPKGTVTEPGDKGDKGGNKPTTLPKTGEDSPLPIYLVGGSLVLLGFVLTRRFKRGN